MPAVDAGDEADTAAATGRGGASGHPDAAVERGVLTEQEAELNARGQRHLDVPEPASPSLTADSCAVALPTRATAQLRVGGLAPQAAGSASRGRDRA